MTSQFEQAALAKTWFYPFVLPSGATTPSYEGGVLDSIHHTRASMMRTALAAHFADGLSQRTALDMACHQGWFSHQLALAGCNDVLATDARDEHIADVQLISSACGLKQVRTLQRDVHDLRSSETGTFDVVLCFGLLYHLENPVGALRVARDLCHGICLVETQIVPNMSGNVDWGNHRFVKPLQGIFGLIDETEETHGPEMSTTGICLAPSLEGLLWILRKVGFSRVELLTPPTDAYEQLKYGKRVMVAAYV
jgi:hypothetical protein